MREAWFNDAACRDVDPAIFFPGRGRQAREAKALCARCPVRDDCLEQTMWAERGLTAEHRHSIAAGLTGRERARLAEATGDHRTRRPSRAPEDDPDFSKQTVAMND